jgi:transcriptional regulator with XRE-family HTH domain
LTGNQTVAYNLRRAREVHGLTQEQAAERLEPFLGERWSKATFSAAERSVEGKRVRKFDADEVLAFAEGFGLPVAWFFLPADPEHRRLQELVKEQTKLALQTSPVTEAIAHVREAMDGLEATAKVTATAYMRGAVQAITHYEKKHKEEHDG